MKNDNFNNKIVQQTTNLKMMDRYIASLVLFTLGDTIGYRNGDYESLYNRKTTTLNVIHELLYDFIDMGGINGINLEGWKVTVNSFLNLATASALTEYKKKNIDLYDEIKSEYKGVVSHIIMDFKERNIKRSIYNGLYQKLKKLSKDDFDEQNEPYDETTWDNSCAIRTISIGLAFFKENDREELIKISIESSKITNNSPMGYLAGLTSSLFASFAINNIYINKWPFLLMDILGSDQVRSYINEENENDYDKYILNWKKYIDLKFKGDTIIKLKSRKNIMFRSKFYFDNFTDENTHVIGLSGYSAMIMAYDCLLDSTGNWEKLIIYSALHFGDTFSVAAICGSLYGAYYGWGDVPSNNLKFLEFREYSFEYGKELYKLFYKETTN